MNTLQRLQELVTEANTTNSTNEKKEILAKYPDLQEILSLIYSNFEQFGVTSKNVLKMWDQLNCFQFANPEYPLIEVLKDLANGKVTGHAAIIHIKTFIEANKDYKELILNALDKNLKCRIDSSLINKVFPGCVPTFDVALAKAIEKVSPSAKPDFEKEDWLCSRKLDGLRCVVIVDENGMATLYSRTGKEFKTLQRVKGAIEELGMENVVFDGEICIMDEDGNEDFTAIMKEYNKKDHVILNPKYNIFDYMSLCDFKAKMGDVSLGARLDCLELILDRNTNPILKMLEQHIVLNEEHLQTMKREGIEKGWEGVMLRKDTGYKGKRSNDLLKVKQFHDAEYVVKSIETGPFRVINSDTGLEEEIQTLTRVNIEHKGYVVGVGSGFSIDQRKEFYSDTSKIVGKTITVKYFEESKNEQGGLSLRFPTVKTIHGEKRET